jgi:cation transport ATPase
VLERRLGIKMNKQYISPLLYTAAMILIIVSRPDFDFFAIAALIIVLLSIGSYINAYKKSK